MKMVRTQSGILKNEKTVNPVMEILTTIPMFENNWEVKSIAEHKILAKTDFSKYIKFDDWCEDYLKQLSEYSDKIGAAFDARLVNGWQVEVIFEIM